MVRHAEITDDPELSSSNTLIILPDQIAFITYPYEWSFAMWQDAALLSLKIAKDALDKGMMLKDATPFNVQFVKGKPIFIDTLSFDIYTGDKPWIAYRQFCECFLAPLLLQHYCHGETGKIFTVYPNGVPLEILISLLPTRAKWNLHTYLHVYLQVSIKGNKTKKNAGPVKKFSKQKMLLLLNGLINYVTKLHIKKGSSAWDDYYEKTILSDNYLREKTKLVQSFLSTVTYTTIIDLGANDGHFSLLYENTDKQIVAVDGDANCVNDLYLTIKEKKITNILPLINTLQNPSPAIGWNNAERFSFNERIKGDVTMALALVHHLAIAANIPLDFIAAWLAPVSKYLLIEFVPKSDEKVQLLLQNREDVFPEYTRAGFEQAFLKNYQIVMQQKITGTERTLYLMQRIW